MTRGGRTDPDLCKALLHTWVPENVDARNCCIACRNAAGRVRKARNYRPIQRRPRYGARADTVALLEDVEFLFGTGLPLAAIETKLDITHEALTTAMRRHGGPLTYDRKTDTWRLTA